MTAATAEARTGRIGTLSVCLILATAANSRTPVSPAAWTTGPYSLLAGDYTLSLYVPKGDAGKYVICVAQNDVPDTVSIPVTVTATSGG